MSIRSISFGLATAALLSTSTLAAASVTPSVAKIAPAAGMNLGLSARAGVAKKHASSLAPAGVVIGVLAVAAVGGGAYAATKHHHHSNVSP